MVRTQIQLTEEQYRAIKELTQQRGISLAEIIRESVDAYLIRKGFRSEEEKRERALSLVGRFPLPSSDLSEEHDRVLDEAFSE